MLNKYKALQIKDIFKTYLRNPKKYIKNKKHVKNIPTS